MKTFEYKNYFVHIGDPISNGMIYATARENDNDDLIKCAFYDYTMQQIIKKMRSHIEYRQNNKNCTVILMKGKA